MLCLLVGIYFKRTTSPENLFLKKQALSKYPKTFSKITNYMVALYRNPDTVGVVIFRQLLY